MSLCVYFAAVGKNNFLYVIGGNPEKTGPEEFFFENGHGIFEVAGIISPFGMMDARRSKFRTPAHPVHLHNYLFMYNELQQEQTTLTAPRKQVVLDESES